MAAQKRINRPHHIRVAPEAKIDTVEMETDVRRLQHLFAR